MNSIRARFLRGEEVKYISHLDLMKVFDRAIRRAGLPIAYSQGFNPHPQMVFGLPLSVGVTSEAEYADFDMAEKIDPDKFGKVLNESLPADLRILESRSLNNKSNIMKEITMACYDVAIFPVRDISMEKIKSGFRELLGLDEINVIKEGKKGPRELDIKPMIYDVEFKDSKSGEVEKIYCENKSDMEIRPSTWVYKYISDILDKDTGGLSYDPRKVFFVSMLLSAGSAANLKPELFIQALNTKYELELKVVKIHRTGLFVNKEDRIINPLDISALS